MGGLFVVANSMSNGRLLVKVRSSAYAVPSGFTFVITHRIGYQGRIYDERVLECIGKAGPKVIAELAIASRADLSAVGCSEEYGIMKDNSSGILFNDDSQESEFVGSTLSSVDQGTGSLVGEYLAMGAQDTQIVSREIVVTGGIRDGSSSWPLVISGLASSETVLYRGMRMD